MRSDRSSSFAFAPLPSASATAAQHLVINEVLVSTTGADSEYFELFGTAGTSLDGLSLIRIEGEDAGQVGDISFRLDFGADDVIGDNGFFLAANDTAAATYGVVPDVTFSGSLENGTSTFALVETASLTGDVATGAEAVLDAVGLLNPDGTEPDVFFYDAPVLGPDGGGFFPAGVKRVEDGVDTDAASDFEFLNFFNDSPPNTPTPGTSGGSGGGGGGTTIDGDPTLVSAIQGSGDASPLVGQTVVIEAVVSGDFQNGDADDFRNLNGFFVMEETADRDGDAATSEGLFIYEGGGDTALDVSEGDRVRVLGTVVERFGKTALEVTEVRIEEAGAVADVLSLAETVTLPGTEDREALESMLVTIAEPLTFSESFDYEDFGQATFTADGPVYQYTQLNAPDADGLAAYEEEVADRSILIDDGTNGRRGDFDPILEPDGDPFTDPAQSRMGQTVTDLTAIFDYDFGAYRLRLPEAEAFDLEEEANPFPAEPEDVGSGYVVGSLNVLNYFTTLDDGSLTDIGLDPRGAESPEELERQTAKLVSIIEGMDADVIGLVEIENDFAGDGFALETLVFELNASAGFSQWDFVDPGQEFVGDDAIAVAFIYDTTTTRLIGDAAILDTPEFLDPLGDATSGDSYNRAALAQTFEDIESGGQFTATINHFKSKGSLTGAEADEDQGDGAGNNDATRTEAARLLAEWLETDPTGSGDEDVLILGDLNSYAQENPIQVLEAAGYTDLAAKYEGEDVYSYRFSGQIGTLDYALANEALEAQVTGATTWNVNADTPVFFDYNLDDTFTGPNILRPTDQGLFDGSDPSRASDHDPVLVGLDLDRDTLILVEGTARNDLLIGTDADERIVSGGGRADFAAGLGGEDTFVFTDTDGRKDKLFLTDFDVAEDTLDLDGASIVKVKETGFGLRLTLDEDRDKIFLFGVDDIDDVTITGDMPFV